MERIKKTKRESLQELVEEYRRDNEVPTVNLKDVAAWAIRTNRWIPPQRSTMRILTRDLADALREEYYTDPQGRRVRMKHAQRISRVGDGERTQLVLWHDITDATRPQMQAAFQQRRHSIVMDCRQLSQDVDSYNENYNTSAVSIQMVFDFREDLEELEGELRQS